MAKWIKIRYGIVNLFFVTTYMTKDGEITCEEFTSACMRQEDISKLLAVQIIDIFVEDDGK